MASASELARKHLEAARAEANTTSVGEDALATALLTAVVELMRGTRSAADIAAQLRFEAENVEEDEDFPFMRP